MLKRIFSILLVLSVGLVLFACKENETTTTEPTSTTENITTTTENPDNIPPAFVGAVHGELEGATHLKDEEIDLLDGVTARDNVSNSDVTLRIADYDGYDKSVPGVYTIVIEAEDEAGNTTTVNKTITVLETLERVLDAILIGDDFTEYVFNDTTALTYTTSGTAFRIHDYVQVMTKEFFVAEYNEHQSEHGYNANVPYFPNGVIVVTDENMNVKLVRIAAGITVEINENGELSTEDLTWSNGLDATNGGGNFKGILEALETVIPDGGYIMFTGNAPDETGRKFLTRNFFYTGYTGGAISEDQFDVDITSVSPELREDYTEIIAVPDKIATPVIDITSHVLSWNPVSNAKEYEIYVDGILVDTVTTTSYAMSNLGLNVTPEGEDGYSITVKAITKDMYQWSTSDMSDAVMYKQIEIQDLDAPVVTVDGTTVSWDLVNGAESYDVYISFADKVVKVGNTTDGTYDISSYVNEYTGNVNVFVKGIGDDEHYDSLNSISVQVMLGEVESLVIGGHTVDVIRTNAYNYFTRRNTDYTKDATGFANSPYLFLITDAYSILDEEFDATATEAFGTIVVLDSNGNPKLINNILPGQTWKLGEGWITDENYASNSAQLDNIADVLVEGDMLLVGKNGNNVEVIFEDLTTQTVKARDFVAYHYINPWEGFTGTEGWRDFPNFIDPTNVTFEITDRLIVINIDAPTVTLDGTTLSWDLVNDADSYDVYVEIGGVSVKVGNTTVNTYDLSVHAAEFTGNVNAYVKAIAEGQNDSDKSDLVQLMLGEVKSLVIGGHTVDVIETTAFNYYTRRNIDFNTDLTGFANAPYLFLITDINSINDADFAATATEAFGTVVVLDSNGNPKLINNILPGQTWKLGEGWITDANYTSNSSQLDNIKDILVDGDMLLVGKNGSNVTVIYEDFTTQLVKARDFVAYHYINPWTNFEGTEGWRDFPNFIDPTNVTFGIIDRVEVMHIDAPVVTTDGMNLTWNLVTNANSYDVYIEFAGVEVLVGSTTTGSFDLSLYANEYTGNVKAYVQAIVDENNKSTHSTSVELMLGQVESLTIGNQTVDVIQTTAYNYFTRRNVDFNTDSTGFANAPYLFLITDINSINDADFAPNANEAYSTIVVLDSNGSPKLINNILATQTWKVGEGWITDGTYSSNAAQLANINDILVEGDMLLIGKNGSSVEITYDDLTTQTVKARDFVAYHYINPWTGYVGTEGWRDFPNFIDPTNVTFEITVK